MHLRRLALLTVAVAACSSEATGPAEDTGVTLPAFELLGDTHWAGAPFTMRMRGDGHRPLDAKLRLAGNLDVDLVYTDDSTLVGTFPTTARGIRHTPRVRFGGRDTVLRAIDINGPTRQNVVSWNFPTGTRFSPPYPVGTGRLLVAATDRFLTFQPWNEFNSQLQGRSVPTRPVAFDMIAPGPTPDPDTWIFRTTPGGPLERWTLRPNIRRIDTLPYLGSGTLQSYAALSDTRLLAFNNIGGTLLRREGDGYITERNFYYEGVSRVILSPRGDRAAITATRGIVSGDDPNGSNDLVVLRVPDGDVAFTLGDATIAVAADFSPDGALLAVASGTAVHHILSTQIRDAESGTILHTLQSDAGPIRGVAFDPVRPIFYQLALTGPNNHFELQAFSTTTWTRLGRMWGRCHHACVNPIQIVADAGNTVFTVELEGKEMVSYRYTVPPVLLSD